MLFEQLLSKVKRDIKTEQNIIDEEDLKLLPLYVNPNQGSRISEDAFTHIKALKKVTATLSRLNLSSNESRVYLYLARFGAQKAITVAEALDVHRTETYKILNSLESQRLVTRIMERPLKFQAVPLENVLTSLIDERRKRVTQLEKNKDELLDIWKSLPKVGASFSKKKQAFQVLESKRQIMLKLDEMLKSCNSKFTIVVQDDDLFWLYNSTSFFENLEEAIREKGIKAELITNTSSLGRSLPNEFKLYLVEVAFVRDKKLPSFFVSDGEEICLFDKDGIDELSGIWTNYDAIMTSHQRLFSMLWDARIMKSG